MIRGALALYMQVVTVDSEEHDNQQGDKDDDDPGPRKKFGGGDHQCHQQRGERAQPVDHKAAPPALLHAAQTPPVAHHPALREGKRHEDADGVQVDEAGGISLEDDEQQAGQHRQADDADRERQAVTPKAN